MVTAEGGGFIEAEHQHAAEMVSYPLRWRGDVIDALRPGVHLRGWNIINPLVSVLTHVHLSRGDIVHLKEEPQRTLNVEDPWEEEVLVPNRRS